MPSSLHMSSTASAPPLAQAVLQGHRPGRVHLRAERREHAHSPVADLVLEPLHHDRAVVGHHTGGLGLLVEVGDEVRGGAVVEPAGAEPLDRVAGAAAQLAGERADGATELERATRARRRARTASSRAGPGAGVTITFWKVMSSMRQVEAPSRNVSPGRLSYTISSSSSPTRVPSGRVTVNSPRSGMVPGLVTARRWAPVRPRTMPCDAVPHEARSAARRTPPTGYRPDEEVEHRGEDLVGELGERCRSCARRPPGRRASTRRARTWRRSAGTARRAGCAGSASPRSGRPASARPRRRPRAGRRGASGTACRGSARRPGGRRGRRAAALGTTAPGRLDLHDEVDRAHVDAELEAGGGDQALEPARTSARPRSASRRSRDSEPWWAFTSSSCSGGCALGLGRSVLALPVQLVEAGGQPLGQPAGVDEDERGAVLLHQLQQARVHRRPDRAARRTGRRRARASGSLDHGAELGHVVDRDDHLDLERLAHPGVDHRDRPRPPHAVVADGGAAEEAGDLLQRALRGGQADPLRRRAARRGAPSGRGARG